MRRRLQHHGPDCKRCQSQLCRRTRQRSDADPVTGAKENITMLIKPSRKQVLDLNAPLKLDAHGRPKTRREFIAQGFMTGSAVVCGTSMFSLFASPQMAQAALSADLEALKESCGIAVQGAGKIPFICFDLAGGANIAGSNVLLG